MDEIKFRTAHEVVKDLISETKCLGNRFAIDIKPDDPVGSKIIDIINECLEGVQTVLHEACPDGEAP